MFYRRAKDKIQALHFENSALKKQLEELQQCTDCENRKKLMSSPVSDDSNHMLTVTDMNFIMYSKLKFCLKLCIKLFVNNILYKIISSKKLI
jgi:hypothetical protein